MASVLEAFGTATTMTVTNLNSLATSATAGWRSAAIDNTSNLYLDYLIQVQLAAVNTAPANSKAFLLFVSALVDGSGSAYATTGATSGGAPNGSEGTLTFPDFTSNPVNIPLLGVIPYVGQNTAIISTPFSVKAAFNGIIPPKFCLGLINHSGMTIAASSNVVTYLGVYNTVA